MGYLQADSPLDRLDYFVEWGGRGWTRLVNHALRDFLGTDLSGLRVLDIGARSGRMACLFGLLGAEVLGIDLNERALPQAREEAARWGVDGRVTFRHYDGDLDILPDASIDVAFTKSVLVVVPDLEGFLRKLERKLAPGGRVVFIENSRGGPLHYLRALKHFGGWKYSEARYFGPAEIALFGQIFSMAAVEKSILPPVCMMLGAKPPG